MNLWTSCLTSATLRLSGVTIGVAGAALAYFSAIDAVKEVGRVVSPAALLAVFPRDPVVSVQMAQLNLQRSKGSSDSRIMAEKVARASLRSYSPNAAALRLMAYSEIDGSKIDRLLASSLAITRRDEAAQLLAAQRSLQRNQLREALDHLDIALRSSQAGREILYPVLARVLSGADGRQILASYFSDPPPWLADFLLFAVNQARDSADPAALLLVGSPLPSSAAYTAVFRRALERLVAGNNFTLARQLFGRIPGARPEVLVSPALTPALLSPANGSMGWRVFGGSAVGAQIVRERNRDRMIMFAASAQRDIAASKLLFMRPGTYRISASYGDSHLGASPSVQWAMQCADGKGWRSISESEASQPRTNNIVSLDFATDDRCATQRLIVIVAGPSDGGEGVTSVDRIDLRPVG